MKPDQMVDALLDGNYSDIALIEEYTDAVLDNKVNEDLVSWARKFGAKKRDEAEFQKAKRQYAVKHGKVDPDKPKQINAFAAAGPVARRNAALKAALGEGSDPKKK